MIHVILFNEQKFYNTIEKLRKHIVWKSTLEKFVKVIHKYPDFHHQIIFQNPSLQGGIKEREKDR